MPAFRRRCRRSVITVCPTDLTCSYVPRRAAETFQGKMCVERKPAPNFVLCCLQEYWRYISTRCLSSNISSGRQVARPALCLHRPICGGRCRHKAARDSRGTKVPVAADCEVIRSRTQAERHLCQSREQKVSEECVPWGRRVGVGAGQVECCGRFRCSPSY